MSKIISFMHISLDGFVAGPQGQMDWIHINQELFGHIGQRIQKSDTALYGCRTFEMMEGYWPTADQKPNATDHDRTHAAWYRKSRKVVLSNTLTHGSENTTIVAGDLAQELAKVKATTESEILLFGSPTASHALLEQNLIDGFWLFVNPVILGSGIPLFPQGIPRQTLHLTCPPRRFEGDVVEHCYAVNQA
jgi:dihydrofolate reductase